MNSRRFIGSFSRLMPQGVYLANATAKISRRHVGLHDVEAWRAENLRRTDAHAGRGSAIGIMPISRHTPRGRTTSRLLRLSPCRHAAQHSRICVTLCRQESTETGCRWPNSTERSINVEDCVWSNFWHKNLQIAFSLSRRERCSEGAAGIIDAGRRNAAYIGG